MKETTLEEGKAMIKFCRKVIKAHFTGKEVKTPELKIMEEERGAFVTLKKYPGEDLRGCIGYTEGIMPLKKALKEVSLSSAFKDPRFPPVKREELESLLVEISLLTHPQLISVKDPQQYPEKIKIGRDGLIVEEDFRKGLLLPQVAVEQNWNSRELLSKTCMKAGLSPNSWLEEEIKVYQFSAEIFSELEPEGKVEKREQ